MNLFPLSLFRFQLNLKSNAIKDKGAIALASALTTNNTLTVLNLSVNTITSPGK